MGKGKGKGKAKGLPPPLVKSTGKGKEKAKGFPPYKGIQGYPGAPHFSKGCSLSQGGAFGASDYSQHHQHLYGLEYDAEKEEIRQRTSANTREQLQASGYGVSGLQAKVETPADPRKPVKVQLMFPEPQPVLKKFVLPAGQKDKDLHEALKLAVAHRRNNRIIEDVWSGTLHLQGCTVLSMGGEKPALERMVKGVEVEVSKPLARPPLPYLSEVSVGRCVLVSENSIDIVMPDSPSTSFAEVSAITRKEMSLKLIGTSGVRLDCTSLYRVDVGPNKIAHDRIMGVLNAIAPRVMMPGSTPNLSLGLLGRNEPVARMLFEDVAGRAMRAKNIDMSKQPILSNAINIVASARAPALPQPWRVKGKMPESAKKFNDSQKAALSCVIDAGRKLTLVQGPPGTGKTATALETVCAWLRTGRGPVLATAFSNQGVDNLAEGLEKRGLKVVRVGSNERKLGCSFEAMFTKYETKMYYVREAKGMASDCYTSIDAHSYRGKGKGKGQGKDGSHGMWDAFTEGTQFEEMIKFLRGCDVVCATCIGVGMSLLNPRECQLDFPYVIVDEAAQVIEPAVLLPLAKGSIQVVMVGDQCQLPATVLSAKAEADGLGVSMFARLVAAGCEVSLLNTQYRMNSAIASFSAAEFYGCRLLTGVRDADRRPLKFHPLLIQPVSFVYCNSKEQYGGKSKANAVEACCVAHIVEQLVAQGIHWWDIGIISPYSAQVLAIQRELGKLKGDAWRASGMVSSVDAYQGSECEVVIISLVRANTDANVGFLQDWRRMNVALTRAKRNCIVIGHLPTLLSTRSTDVWRHWVQHYWAGEMKADLVQWAGYKVASIPEDAEVLLCLNEFVPGIQSRTAHQNGSMHGRASIRGPRGRGKGGKWGQCSQVSRSHPS